MDVNPTNTANGPRIRPARDDDYEAILAVWAAAGLQVRGEGRDARAPFLEQLERFADLYLVAEHEGSLVGVVLGTHDGRKGWINRLAVIPEFRRRGVAAALVRDCEKAIRGHGIEIVTALVEPASEASAALFARLGYHEDVPVRYFRKVTTPDW